jgi:hypothetical protein
MPLAPSTTQVFPQTAPFFPKWTCLGKFAPNVLSPVTFVLFSEALQNMPMHYHRTRNDRNHVHHSWYKPSGLCDIVYNW